MSAVVPGTIETERDRVEVQKRPILAGAMSLSGAQIARRGFRSVFLLLSARILGPEVFGLYVLLFTINEILAVLAGSGFSDYITREVSKSPGMARQYLFRIVQLHCFYLLPIISGLLSILVVLGYSRATLASAALLSLTLFPRGVVESSQGIIRSAHRFRLIFWIELIEGLVLVGAGTIMLFSGYGILGLVWAELVSVLAGAAIALLASLRLFPVRSAASLGWLKLVRETFVFNIYPLISNTYDRVDVIILARLVGNAAVGTYSLGYKGYAALSILPYGIMGSLFPTLAKSEWNRMEKDKCRITLQRLYVGALFLILAAMFIVDRLVRIVLGSSYQGTALTVKILVWATIPMFLNYAFNTFLLARRRERVFLWTASVCTVFNVAANLLLIPYYSYVAAAAITILTELLLLGLNIVLLRKSLGYTLLPNNVIPDSLFFLALIAIAEGAVRFMPPFIVDVAALSVFAAYLNLTGVITWANNRRDYGAHVA